MTRRAKRPKNGEGGLFAERELHAGKITPPSLFRAHRGVSSYEFQLAPVCASGGGRPAGDRRRRACGRTAGGRRLVGGRTAGGRRAAGGWRELGQTRQNRPKANLARPRFITKKIVSLFLDAFFATWYFLKIYRRIPKIRTLNSRKRSPEEQKRPLAHAPQARDGVDDARDGCKKAEPKLRLSTCSMFAARINAC